MANCNHTLALASKYGMDVVLGVVSDMAITGDFNITQETAANLIPIIVGVAKTKGSMLRFVENEMLDAVGTLPRDYFKTNEKEFDRIMQTMLKNETYLGYIAHLEQPKWQSLIQSIETPPTGDVHEAMMFYKYDSWDINSLLSYYKNNEIILDKKIINNIDKLNIYIKNMTDYINTQTLKKPITVYRDDGDFLLTRIKLNNGKTIAEEIEIISKIKEKDTADKLIKKLAKKAYNSSVVQERFMSTTFVKDLHFDKNKNIRWEFSVPKGTKGTFIEPYNTLNRNGNQLEYLLQRDSKIIIKDIQKIDKKWFIKADIIQE